MNCDDARKLLSDRLDRPLTTEQAAQLRAHLMTCQDCREFNRALNDSVAGIGQLPRSLPSNRVRDKVNSYVALHPEYGDGQHRSWMRQAAGLSAAAIVLVAVSALLIVMLRGQTSGPSGAQIASQPTRQNSVMSTPASKQTGTPRTYTFAPSPPTPTPQNDNPLPPAARSTLVPNLDPQPSASATSSAPEPTPSTTPTSAEPTLTVDQANQVVTDYFNAINQKDYATAWSLFSEQMKASQGAPDLKTFAGGYTETDHDDVQIINNVPDPQFGGYDAMVQVAAYQTDGTVKWYSGTYTVGMVGGKPLLVSANVRQYPTSAASTSVDTSLPACTSNQLGAPQDLTGISSMSERSYTVSFANTGPTCQLSTTLTVTITGITGDGLLWVFGNNQPQPLVITIPSGGIHQELDWKNWCAPSLTATIAVKVGGEVIGSLDNQATPGCNDPESPTTVGVGQTNPLSHATTWAGTVVSVDGGSTIRLKMPDKSVQILSIDPTATIADANGGAIDVSSIQPGESLTAKGQIAANGDTLVATSLSVGTAPSSGSSGTASPSPTPAVKP